MGRPPTRPKGFRDGFYIEIVNRGGSQTMKLRCDSREEMEQKAAMYTAAKKHVNILGEHKKGIWVDQPQEEPAQRGRKKKVKPVVDDDAEMEFELPEELSEADMKALEEGKAPKAPKGEKEPKPKKEPKAPKAEKPAKAPKAEKAKPAKVAKPAKAAKPVKVKPVKSAKAKPVKPAKAQKAKPAKPAKKAVKVAKKSAPKPAAKKAKPVAKKKKK